MKKKLFIGLGLFGIAFTGAAFTANRALLTNHYIQKPDSCEPIPPTECDLMSANQCNENDGTGNWPVYQSQNSEDPDQCETKLFRPTKP